MNDEFNYKKLDKIIHSPVRLGIMTALVTQKEVDFNFLKAKLNLTDGNLSANTSKLEEAGFISVKKYFRGKKPVTIYSITRRGRKAFDEYVRNLEKIIKGV